MITKLSLQKINIENSKNWFKTLTVASLILVGSCSQEDDTIISETPTEVSIKAKAASSVKLSYDNITVTTEESESPLKNIDDESLDTKWSGFGESVNLDIDFEKTVLVDYLKIAFHKGHQRAFKFSYWGSDDGISWELNGTKNSSGLTSEYEEFDLSNVTTRYFRIEFKGNTVDNWNSVSELEIYGTQELTVVEKVSYQVLNISAEEEGNLIANINDDSLDTRWAGFGESVNLDIDFEKEILVDYLRMDFHKGEERAFKFSYWVSNNAESWELKGTETSSGKDTGYEIFNLSDVSTRYLRIEFQGNENDDWNSVTELEAYATTDVELDYFVRIEAEDYIEQSGIQTEETSDIDGGLNVGYIDTEDSLSYAVNIPTTGEYTIGFRVASIESGAAFDIYEGDVKIGSVSEPKTGSWHNWVTTTVNVNMTAGDQILRLVATGGDWNINWLEINNSSSSYVLVPSKIEAEDFQNQFGVRSEETADIDGNLNVAYIDAGDFMLYTIKVPSSKEYVIDFRLASIESGAAFDIYEGDVKVGSVSSPSTDGFQNWETVSTNVVLSSGNQVLKILATANNWNINWLEVKEIDGNGNEEEEEVIEDTCAATAPVGLSSKVTSDSVVLTWDTVADISHYNLRYRIVGSTTWITNKSIEATTFTLYDLTAGSEYEWQLKSECADGSASDYKESASTFVTEAGTNPVPGGSLDPNKTPAENFDLSQWKLTPSSGNDVSVSDLNDNFEIENQFYTASDGGMVFKNYPEGAGTTTNSTYSRVEFREMLDTSADDTSISKNNWVFSSSSSSNQSKSGGVGGVLTATLAVNKVTTTSESDAQLGRIVIGQIHASDNEPIRLYYKKMPGDSKGAIYFVHEDSKGVEAAVNIIGDFAVETKGDSAGDYTGASEPSNGIPLDEVFSYKIEVIGTMLYAHIYRDGYTNLTGEYDMKDSGYADDWMYFKAGLYSQNKTVKSSSDYEQVTFYALENTHN